MAAASRRTPSRSREVAQAYAMLADPGAVPAKDPRRALAPALTHRPRRDAREPGDGRRPPRPARHVADEGRRRAGSSARPAWRRCAASRSCPVRGSARAGRPRRAWRSRSRTATATTAGRGPRRSRRSARPGVLDGQALRVARPLPPADDPRPARPGRGRVDRRVRARAGRRADRLSRAGVRRAPAVRAERAATDDGPRRRSVPTLGLTRGATLDEVKRAYRRAGQGEPSRRGRRGGAAAVPRDPGRLRPADRRARRAGRPRRPGRRRGAAAAAPTATPWDPDRGPLPRRRDRAYGGRRAAGRGPTPAAGPRTGSRTVAAAATAAPATRPAAGRGAGPGPSRARAGRGRREQGDARLDVLRRRRRGAVRARLGRGVVVRDDVGHVLDDQPEGVRRPAQARAGVPGRARRALAGGRGRGRRRPTRTPPSADGDPPAAPAGAAAADRDATGATRTARRAAARAPPTHTTSSWWEATAGHRRRRRRAVGEARPAGDRRRRSAPDPAARPGAAGRRPGAAHGDHASTRPPAASAGARPRRDASSRRSAPGSTTLGPAPSAASAGPSSAGLPIALGIGWLGGEISGCGRFAAGCDDGGRRWRLARADRPPSRRCSSCRRLARDRVGRDARDARRRHPGRAAALGHRRAPTTPPPAGSRSSGLLVIAWVGRARASASSASCAGRPCARAAGIGARPSRILRRMPRRHDQRDLSAAAQEYLLALRVTAGADDGGRVTAAAVARHLGVTTQAASEMFRRLVADGLVDHADGRELRLTSAGRAAADAIFRRHALLEWLLTSVVGLGWAESDEEAMRLQGAISPRVEARLDEMLGHPETCPHGNPIDAATAKRRPGGRPPVARSRPASARRSTASPRRPRRTPACCRTSRRAPSSPARRSRSSPAPNRSIR